MAPTPRRRFFRRAPRREGAGGRGGRPRPKRRRREHRRDGTAASLLALQETRSSTSTAGSCPMISRPRNRCRWLRLRPELVPPRPLVGVAHGPPDVVPDVAVGHGVAHVAVVAAAEVFIGGLEVAPGEGPVAAGVAGRFRVGLVSVPLAKRLVAVAAEVVRLVGRNWCARGAAVRPALVAPMFTADPLARLSRSAILDATCPGGGTVDAADSKSAARKGVWVRIPPRVQARAGVGL